MAADFKIGICRRSIKAMVEEASFDFLRIADERAKTAMITGIQKIRTARQDRCRAYGKKFRASPEVVAIEPGLKRPTGGVLLSGKAPSHEQSSKWLREEDLNLWQLIYLPGHVAII